MIQLTQTSADLGKKGNCWQTAIACILELPAEQLPDQTKLENKDSFYSNVINAYLWTHHNLMYSELYEYQFDGIESLKGSYHLMCGPTVRTPINKVHHAVVGYNGKMVWDPHPSRAGLVSAERWGILVPVPARLSKERQEHIAAGNEFWTKTYKCACPACLDDVR